MGRQLLSCLFLQPLGKHTALAEDGRDAGRGEDGQLAWAFLPEDMSERGGGHGIVPRAAALLHADAVGGVIDERTDAPDGSGRIARESLMVSTVSTPYTDLAISGYRDTRQQRAAGIHIVAPARESLKKRLQSNPSLH